MAKKEDILNAAKKAAEVIKEKVEQVAEREEVKEAMEAVAEAAKKTGKAAVAAAEELIAPKAEAPKAEAKPAAKKETKIITPADAKIPAGPLELKWTNYKNHQKLVNPANKRRLDVIVIGTGLAGELPERR